jgi:hypothetical protein
MMVQFERRNSSGVIQNDTARTDNVVSALSGFEACLFSDTDLEKRLNEALDENKKKDATIMRLRDQIHEYQAQERSMEAKIIQLSMDLAMAKAEADRQQLKMSRSEQQQPQKCTLHEAEEANPLPPFAPLPPLASAQHKRKPRGHNRSKSLMNIPTHLVVQIVDADEETISNNIGSKVRHCLGNLDSSFRNLRQSVLMGSMNTDAETEKITKSLTESMNTMNTSSFQGRHCLGNLDSSFRNLRQSVLMGSMNTDAETEKITKSLTEYMNTMNTSSFHSIVKDDEFDCDNNSRIDWADVEGIESDVESVG